MSAGPVTALSTHAQGLGELYEAHAGQVARWAARIGGPLIDPEDIVQDVFVLVHDLLPSFRGEARVTTWLYRITENVVRRRRRRERLRRIFIADQKLPERVSSSPSAPQQLEDQQRARLVYRTIDKLPERQRNALILFELEGLSAEAIGELTGQTPNAVWVTLHRARKSFLEKLGSERGEVET